MRYLLLGTQVVLEQAWPHGREEGSFIQFIQFIHSASSIHSPTSNIRFRHS